MRALPLLLLFSFPCAAQGLPDYLKRALERQAVPEPEAKDAAQGCPSGMSAIGADLCIDKWEASVVDDATGADASPYYALGSGKGYGGARWQRARWKAKPARDEAKYPLPPLPAVQASDAFEPRAVSRPGVWPQGFATSATAAKACANAGKRLCTRAEWYKACAGSRASKAAFAVTFPYGPKYEKGKCNFNLSSANGFSVLGRSNTELDDPRFMLVEDGGRRVLARTGSFPGCRDEGYDVYDMVGNQDEIVSDDGATPGSMTFVGSFYGRWQKDGPYGCASAITTHGKGYFDYSLGFRCCAARRKE